VLAWLCKPLSTITNTIGNFSGISGNSTCLNGQPGQGTQKPNPTGASSNPGGTKPAKPADGAVPMPK
jgi:hypothetical protein